MLVGFNFCKNTKSGKTKRLSQKPTIFVILSLPAAGRLDWESHSGFTLIGVGNDVLLLGLPLLNLNLTYSPTEAGHQAECLCKHSLLFAL